ncbi:MAG: ABC transporter permease [Micrococcus sp.]|nr:ABC transporter permease [Micrococcus sp.]
MSGNAVVTVLAIVLSLVISAILIIVTNPRVTESAGYFFARPLDTLSAAWTAISEAYLALFRGAIFNYNGTTTVQMFRPLTETLTVATPLIIVALGVAIAFRTGLFNIGGQGQFLIGAMFATVGGVYLNLPFGVHLLVVIIMAALGGLLWGGLVGVLKAYTGAHEVILTIMLNYVALHLVSYALNTPFLRREGTNNPISATFAETATFPLLVSSSFRLHWGFVMAVLLTLFAWWLLERSTLGFRLRAVGANPTAAQTAGISVKGGYIAAMGIAGALAGLGAVSHISGTEKVLTSGIAGQFGFDAITVALLGRSNPVGVLFAGLLFGALRAGGATMQTQTGVPIDIVLVVQSFIVLFIAAPPLVRTLFRLPAPSAARARKKADVVTQPALAGAAVSGSGGEAVAPSATSGEAAAEGATATPDANPDPDGGPPADPGSDVPARTEEEGR